MNERSEIGAPTTETCDRCGGSGRLTIYDTATYIGQECYPIGDEPCPKCCPDDDDDLTPADDEPSDPDGECYRGGEYASALAEEQARIQRELK